MNADVLAQLMTARKYLSSPEKWCQGALKRGSRVCLSGACTEGKTYASPETCERLRNSIEAVFPAFFSYADTVTGFNDHATRRFDEVIAVLDHAIAAEREV